MKQLLHRWFPKQFPNEKVKEFISELDELEFSLFSSEAIQEAMLKATGSVGNVGFGYVKNHLKKWAIDTQDQIFENENKCGPVRDRCLFAITYFIRQDVHTRRYHLNSQNQYAGWVPLKHILDLPGGLLLDIWIKGGKELVKSGALTEEKYKQGCCNFFWEIRWTSEEEANEWKKKYGNNNMANLQEEEFEEIQKEQATEFQL